MLPQLLLSAALCLTCVHAGCRCLGAAISALSRNWWTATAAAAWLWFLADVVLDVSLPPYLFPVQTLRGDEDVLPVGVGEPALLWALARTCAPRGLSRAAFAALYVLASTLAVSMVAHLVDPEHLPSPERWTRYTGVVGAFYAAHALWCDAMAPSDRPHCPVEA